MEWIQSLIGPRCILCGKRGPLKHTDYVGGYENYGELHEYGEDLSAVTWVVKYGMYMEKEKNKQWSFHPTCVQEVLCKPEVHGHVKVDIALEIVDRKDTERARKEQARLLKQEQDLQRKTTIKAACRRVEHGHLLLD